MIVGGATAILGMWERASTAEVPSGPPATAEFVSDEPRLPTLNTARQDLPQPSAAIDKTKPVKAFIIAGQPSMAGRVDLTTLQRFAGEIDSAASHSFRLRDQQGWKERDDVWALASEPHGHATRSGALSVGFGETANEIGPELGLGHVLGNHFDEQVVILRISSPPQALGDQFRPASSDSPGGTAYQALVADVANILDEFEKSPNCQGTGVEVAGLFWIQGMCDGTDPQHRAAYADNLANLVRDLRKQWHAPAMKVVIAEFCRAPTGDEQQEPIRKHLQWLQQSHAQVAGQAEFQDSVRFVTAMHDINIPSPEATMTMFHANPRNLLDLGEGCGHAMLELQMRP